MKQIILHIGLQKTGTTALQLFFSENRQALKEKYIDYYKPVYDHNSWGGYANSSFLRELVLQEIDQGENKSSASMIKEECLHFQKKIYEHETMVLSEESFTETCWDYPDFWKKMKTALDDLCGGCAIKIVLCLRRVDDWILSLWKTKVFGVEKEIRSFSHFLEDAKMNGLLSFDRLVLDLEEAFGRQNVIIYPYDSASASNYYRIFMSISGLMWSDEYIIPEGKIFASPTMNATAALQLIRRDDIASSVMEYQLVRAARLFSERFPERIPCYPMDAKLRETLVRDYYPSLDALAKRYRFDSSSFKDIIKPYKVWTENKLREQQNAELILRIAKLSHEDQARLRVELT